MFREDSRRTKVKKEGKYRKGRRKYKRKGKDVGEQHKNKAEQEERGTKKNALVILTLYGNLYCQL